MEGNIFPEFDLGIADKAKKVAKAIGSLITHRPTHAPLHMSNHYRGEPTDGEAYQPELPFEAHVELVTDNTELLKDLILQARIAREAKQG